jgi:photosystem II stability/assembly factor-like uncharacterized protein
VILATVSDGPHGDNVHGQLYRTADAGGTWTHVRDGFPDATRDNINTFQVVFAPDGTAWAAVGKVLFVGTEDGTHWSTFWEAPSEIGMISCPL